MFSFYGAKEALAPVYPAPKYGRINEPFAGSARYSLLHYENDVTLIDKDHKIIELWKFLQSATYHDIMELPDLEVGDDIREIKWLSPMERRLLGMHVSPASAHQKATAMKRCNWNTAKHQIAENLHKIRHWEFICGNYTNAPDVRATWFIDPPYQDKGKWYDCSSKHIDYAHLGAWCGELRGLIMVCENAGAKWMPGRPTSLRANHRGMIQANHEVVWIKERK